MQFKQPYNDTCKISLYLPINVDETNEKYSNMTQKLNSSFLIIYN